MISAVNCDVCNTQLFPELQLSARFNSLDKTIDTSYRHKYINNTLKYFGTFGELWVCCLFRHGSASIDQIKIKKELEREREWNAFALFLLRLLHHPFHNCEGWTILQLYLSELKGMISNSRLSLSPAVRMLFHIHRLHCTFCNNSECVSVFSIWLAHCEFSAPFLRNRFEPNK